MKNRTFNIIVLSFLLMMFGLIAIERTSNETFLKIQNYTVSVDGGPDFVYRNITNLNAYYVARYTSTNYQYISAIEVTDSRHTITSTDVSQSSMNYNYLVSEGITVTNTCAIVAITMLLNYYEDNNLLITFNNGNTSTDWFIRTMNIALANDLTTATEGTYLVDIDNIIPLVLNSLQLTTAMHGDNEYCNIYSKIQSNIGEVVPALFHIPDHSTLAKGYMQYKVTVNERYWSWFTWKWRQVDKIEEVLIINEGWYNYGYSYYPVDLISDGLLNTGPYCMTEIIQ